MLGSFSTLNVTVVWVPRFSRRRLLLIKTRWARLRSESMARGRGTLSSIASLCSLRQQCGAMASNLRNRSQMATSLFCCSIDWPHQLTLCVNTIWAVCFRHFRVRVRVQLCTFWVWARVCVWRLVAKHRPGTAVIQVLNFEDIGNTSLRCWNVRDIWAGEDVGRQNLTFTATAVPPHGCRFLRLSKGEICAAAPPPPPAVCPSGYTQHTGGYWQNTGTMAL